MVCLSEAQSWRDEVQVDGRPYVPTVEQIHEAFDWIKSVRYNQPLHLGGDLAHLLLTPFPSGHTLGGTLFKLRSPTSGTILYATGINHTGERHLDGMVGGRGYDEGLIRPDLLIVEAGRANTVNHKRKEREKVLIDTITQTLDGGRSVLMPCDPSPRLLELLVLLDQHWSFRSKQRDFQYPLCLVSRTGQDVVNFAKSLVEWMGGLVKDSAAGEDILAVAAGRKRRKGGEDFTTLDFRHVRFFATPADLLQAFPINRPKVVLAVPPNMSHGPSRWLFTAMASTEGNVILLTGKGDDGTLTRELYDGARGTIELDLDSKVPLAGIELEEHLEAERQEHEKEAATKAAAERSRRMLEADDLDSDSDSDSESGEVQNANDYTGREVDDSRQMSFDIYVKGQQTRAAKGMARYRMFPFIERRARMDDYGEGLDIGQWLRKGREIAEEGETEEVREAKRKKEAEDKRMVSIMMQEIGVEEGKLMVECPARAAEQIHHRACYGNDQGVCGSCRYGGSTRWTGDQDHHWGSPASQTGTYDIGQLRRPMRSATSHTLPSELICTDSRPLAGRSNRKHARPLFHHPHLCPLYQRDHQDRRTRPVLLAHPRGRHLVPAQ